MPNKKLQNATDISLFQKTFILANRREFDTKTLASFEILNYYKYLLTHKDFIGNLQNRNSLLKLKIIMCVVQTGEGRFSIYKILKFSYLTVWHLFTEFNLKISTPLAIFIHALLGIIQKNPRFILGAKCITTGHSI